MENIQQNKESQAHLTGTQRLEADFHIGMGRGRLGKKGLWTTE